MPKVGVGPSEPCFGSSEQFSKNLGHPKLKDLISFCLPAPEFFEHSLSPLSPDAHKGRRGKLLILAGSAQMPGACLLSTEAALLAAPGYVSVFAPEKAYSALLTCCPLALIRAREWEEVLRKERQARTLSSTTARSAGLVLDEAFFTDISISIETVSAEKASEKVQPASPESQWQRREQALQCLLMEEYRSWLEFALLRAKPAADTGFEWRAKNGKTCLLLGPGLGEEDWSLLYVKQALQLPLPLLLDASALSLVARDYGAFLPLFQARQEKGMPEVLLTPHLGEARRLLKAATLAQPEVFALADEEGEVEGFARLSQTLGVGLLVKSAESQLFFASPSEGAKSFFHFLSHQARARQVQQRAKERELALDLQPFCLAGENAKKSALFRLRLPWAAPALSRAGSGDVLAGLAASLFVQQLECSLLQAVVTAHSLCVTAARGYSQRQTVSTFGLEQQLEEIRQLLPSYYREARGKSLGEDG